MLGASKLALATLRALMLTTSIKSVSSPDVLVPTKVRV
jgi:hypothetical protein